MISSIASASTNSTNATQHARPKPEDIFKKMDTNGDGSVSQQEFESAFVSISQKGGQAADSTSTADLKAKADAIYKKMDSNGDGQVSETEFSAAAKANAAQHAEGAKGGHAHHAHGGGGGGAEGASQAKTYDPADTNKDGVVSAQEEQVYQASQAAKTALNNNAAEAIQTYSGVEASS